MDYELEVNVKRHTMAHVLAAAVKELYGEVKFGLGHNLLGHV